MNILPARCIGVLTLLFMISGAQAVPVSYEFSGQINRILDTNNYTTGLVSTSSTFTGRMTYDTENFGFSVPGSLPDIRHYIDFGANFSMSLIIDDSIVFIPTPGAAVSIRDADTAGSRDALFFESTNVRGDTPGSPPDSWGLPLGDTNWWLQFLFLSSGPDSWDTFDLPERLPLEDLVDQAVRISAGDLSYFGSLVGDGYEISGEITDIRLVSLPEPSTVWLLACGLGLLGWFRGKLERVATRNRNK